MKQLQFPIVRVISDDFDGYMTESCYKEMRLQMSTGDFHMHTHAEVLTIDPDSYSGTEFLYDYDQEVDELIEIGMVKEFTL